MDEKNMCAHPSDDDEFERLIENIRRLNRLNNRVQRLTNFFLQIAHGATGRRRAFVAWLDENENKIRRNGDT